MYLEAVVVVSSLLRRAAKAILRAILKTTTRWHLSVNPILQNRYPILIKCLNIRVTKPISVKCLNIRENIGVTKPISDIGKMLKYQGYKIDIRYW